MNITKNKETIASKIQNIMFNNQGKIYSINDFYDLGTKNTVKSILYRLTKEGKIFRLIDGLYTWPEYSNILKQYCHPSTDEIAFKIAKKFSWIIAPMKEAALNYSGLSRQIPNVYIYISNGENRQYKYLNKKIIFKHTSNRNISFYSLELSVLIQAIKAVGRNKITDEDIERLAIFAKKIKEDLDKDTLKVPFWIREILLKIKKKNENN